MGAHHGSFTAGPDEFWVVVPEAKRRYRYPGRKRVPDRQVLAGILA